MPKRQHMRATLREGRTDWYRIQNNAPARAATVSIYDEIGYYGVTAADFAAEVSALDVDTIDLRLNSPGGEVFDGIAIHNALKNHPATVNVTVDGLAASAASFIAMAGDRIVMGRGSQMMIHNAHGMCIGEAKDMRQLADQLDRIGDTIAGFYAERAGGDVAEWRERMAAETWYSGEEAVAAGLADEYVKPKGKTGPPAAEWDLSIFTYAGRENAPPPSPQTHDAPRTPVNDDGGSPFQQFKARLTAGGGPQ